MKRMILMIILALLLAGSAGAEKPLRVVCTLTDLAWLAEQVGGQDAEVVALCPGEYDPHFLPAKPSFARRLGKADLLCYSGLELEVGWLPVLMDKARNRKLHPGGLGELDCSQALERVLDIPTGGISRAQGDVHPEGNPHYLLNPHNGVLVMRLMAERMAVLRPKAADGFRDRAEVAVVDLQKRIKAWEKRSASLRGQPVVQYHQQWEYLADWLGLKILGDVEHRPGIAPSPRHVSKLATQARKANVELLLAAPWNHLDAAGKAAGRMSARLVVLPPAVGALSGVSGYGEMFDRIIEDLLLGKGGNDG
ncbi:MAG: zinc ABC transporter substrate-binding protein [Gemmatimonadales bacterium]|nr:zinc ABC transporter substrate-binding protein [Gemmatimonadales bacterium]